MGAWDCGNFDNDTACDWADDLEDGGDLSAVEAAIDPVLAAGSAPLDAELAWEALAACEVLARLNGNWGRRNACTEAVDAWVTAHPMAPPQDLVARAALAIERVVTAPSELLALWDEGGRNDVWHAVIDDLRARLAAPRAPGRPAGH